MEVYLIEKEKMILLLKALFCTAKASILAMILLSIIKEQSSLPDTSL